MKAGQSDRIEEDVTLGRVACEKVILEKKNQGEGG